MSRIVLVVREPAQALAWRDVLAAGCHEVVAVTNAARSARALLTQHQPQLVLCDMRLLDGTALAMIQWLAALPQVTGDPNDGGFVSTMPMRELLFGYSEEFGQCQQCVSALVDQAG